MKEILSLQNPKFKIWKSLLESKGIRKQNKTIVSGKKVLEDLLRAFPEKSLEWLIPSESCREGSSQMLWINELAPNLPKFTLPKDLFSQVDIFGTNTPLAVFEVPNIVLRDLSLAPEGLELLLPFGDPGNLGGILRSSAAFGVNSVILLQEACHPFHPKVSRASAGLNFHLNFGWGPSSQELSETRNLIALHTKGQGINEFSWPKDLYLFVGEEGPGLPESLRSQDQKCLQIPTRSHVESLNAMVAASIALQSYFAFHSH